MLRPRLALAILTAVVFINIIDRQLVGILAEPIKNDLHLTDTQLGLLTGLAFSLFYAVMGIPIARLADRGNRVKVIATATAAWSVMTAACGVAASFPLLLLARMGVAVGEAGCLPPTYSLISEYFPAHRRASALSALQVGSAFAVFTALFIGGTLAQHLGWRMTFLLAAIPGLFLAVIAAVFLIEPRALRAGTMEQKNKDEQVLPLMAAVRQLFSRRAFVHLLIGGAFASITIYCLLIWTPSYFQRVFGWSIASTGASLGILFGIGGAVGGVLSGNIGDRMFARDKGAHGRLPSMLMLAAAPVLVCGLLAPNAIVALVLIAIAQMLSNSWQPCVLGAMQGVAEPRTRALASAISGLVINIIGLGLGPLIVGALSDALEPQFATQTLRYALLPCAAAYLFSAYQLNLAARHLRTS